MREKRDKIFKINTWEISPSQREISFKIIHSLYIILLDISSVHHVNVFRNNSCPCKLWKDVSW